MDPMMPAPVDDGAATFPDDAKIEAGKPIPGSLEAMLDPSQPLHGKILNRIKSRTELARRHAEKRFDDWDRVDEKRRLFVNLATPARKGDRTEDLTKKEMPFERSIVMPMTYAILQTRLSECYSQYAFRAPFNQLDGVGIEDTKPAKIVEMKLDYDYQQSDGPLTVYSLIQDADAYGVGYIYDHWDEEYGWKTTPPDPMQAAIAQEFGLPMPEPSIDWALLKQFTRWSEVDPYMALPDPRVTRRHIQQGEFFGHDAYRPHFWLVERSQQNGGNYFNLDNLKGAANESGQDTRVSSGRGRNRAKDEFAIRASGDEKDKGFYTITNMQIKIVPSDWGLGDGDIPEIWWFAIADERIIIRCHRSAYMHNQFTYAAGESNFDPHQYANPGTAELLDGLQRTTDWLVNSRIENVRKFLNDMLLYAPELIEEDDIMHPGAARWLRTTPQGTLAAMQGLPLDAMIKQFQVQDLTGTHFEVVQFLQDMMNRLGAANDTMQGQNLPQKRTLGEINNAIGAGSKRITMFAKTLDSMVFKPLAMRSIMNAQQFYDIEQWVRLAGDYAELDMDKSLDRILISKADMAGNFDYKPMSALTPQDPARMLAVWQSIFDTVVATPALSTPDPLDPQVMNLKKLFKHMARMGGAREVDTFFANLPAMTGPGAAPPGVLPDQQIEQGVQAGNMVPIQ